MSKNLIISDQVIINKIYEVRGMKVMLDRDLAEIYQVETRRLNEQVKRNVARFPSDFMFQLSDAEYQTLMSQSATSKRGGNRKLPNVFTEHGVLMLSSVLNSENAIQANIQIMRVYTQLRSTIFANNEILLRLEKLDNKILNLGHDVSMHDGEIDTLFELIKEITVAKQLSKPPQPIGFRTTSFKENNPTIDSRMDKSK